MRVPPTPLYKRVVPGQPGGFCFWDLRRRAILDPMVTVVLSFGCCFSHSWRSCISSQLAPVHSPLLLSIVDFVCSSYQAHNYSSFTVWSPLRSELVAKFFLSGRLFFAQLWIRARVRKSGVFVTVNSVTVNSVYSLPLCAWVCIARFFLPRCAQHSVNDALLLPHHFVTCAVFVTGAVNFCLVGLGFSASFLYSLAALAGSLPF